MTEAELLTIRDEVGTVPTDTEIGDIYDRLGSVGGTIYALLSRQLAELLNNPASFNVSGEYSQDVRANIEALQKKIQAYAAFAPGAEGVGLSQVNLVEPARRRRR